MRKYLWGTFLVTGLISAGAANAAPPQVLSNQIIASCATEVHLPPESSCSVRIVDPRVEYTCKVSYGLKNQHRIVILLDDGTTKTSEYTDLLKKTDSFRYAHPDSSYAKQQAYRQAEDRASVLEANRCK